MTPLEQNYENLAQTIIRNLKKRQMEGSYAPDGRTAVRMALELMPAGSSVAWGGSVTLGQIGLTDAVRNAGYAVIDRNLAKTPEEQAAVKARTINADFFLMSTNAITMDGELLNIDGHGSRLGYMIFGPSRVLVLAGMNKVCPDRQSAELRVRNLASPPNCVRLNRDTPCAKTGRCADCYSPECICSQFVYTRRSSAPGRIHVILIGETLGF